MLACGGLVLADYWLVVITHNDWILLFNSVAWFTCQSVMIINNVFVPMYTMYSMIVLQLAWWILDMAPNS